VPDSLNRGVVMQIKDRDGFKFGVKCEFCESKDTMPLSKEKVETDKVVTARLTAIEDTQKHLKVPVQPCAEMIALQNEKAETEKDVKDIKKSVVKEGAVWGFRGVVLFIMLKLGIDKWGG